MSGRTILVIEDNEQNLYLVRFLLQKNEYEVVEARGAARRSPCRALGWRSVHGMTARAQARKRVELARRSFVADGRVPSSIRLEIFLQRPGPTLLQIDTGVHTGTTAASLRDFEVMRRTRAGARIDLSINVERVTIAGSAYVLTTVQDVTQRKQAEAALRTKEERMRLAQQVARVGTFEWDIRSGVNTWSPELEAMYGLPRGGFAGTEAAWERLVHPDDRTQAVQQVERALRPGEPIEVDWRVVWPDGSVHWLAGRANAFKDHRASCSPELLVKGTEHPWVAGADSIAPSTSHGVEAVAERVLTVAERTFLQTVVRTPGQEVVRIYGTAFRGHSSLGARTIGEAR